MTDLNITVYKENIFRYGKIKVQIFDYMHYKIGNIYPSKKVIATLLFINK